MKIEINRRNVTSCRSIANSWNGHEIVLRGIRVGNESCFADSERRLMRIEKDESLSFSFLFFIHPTRCHIFVPLTIQKFSNSYVLNIIVFFFSFSVTRSWQRRRLFDVWAQTDREILWKIYFWKIYFDSSPFSKLLIFHFSSVSHSIT